MPSVTRKTQSARAERRDQIRSRLLTAVESLLAEGESFTELPVGRRHPPVSWSPPASRSAASLASANFRTFPVSQTVWTVCPVQSLPWSGGQCQSSTGNL